MSDRDNKFIIGDNTDGYRRSGKNDATQQFDIPENRRVRPQGQPRQQRPEPAQRQRQPVQQRPLRQGSAAPQRRRPNPNGTQRSSRQPVKQSPMSANERRQQHSQMRKNQNRLKQLVRYVLIAAATIGVVAALSLTVFFRVNEISVQGNSPYSAEQIINACGINVGENVIRCDKDSVSERLAAALPYIDSASVKAPLSGKVLITVKETKGRFSLLNGTQCVVLDGKGKVLEITSEEEYSDYTMIIGAAVVSCEPGKTIEFSQGSSFDLIKSIVTELDNAAIDSITSINISDVDYIQVVHNARLTLIVGDSDKLPRKFALAARVIERENKIDPMQYGKIDLTIEGKAYFRPDTQTVDGETDIDTDSQDDEESIE